MAPHAVAVTPTSSRCQKLSSWGKYLLTRCCSQCCEPAAGPSGLLRGYVSSSQVELQLKQPSPPHTPSWQLRSLWKLSKLYYGNFMQTEFFLSQMLFALILLLKISFSIFLWGGSLNRSWSIKKKLPKCKGRDQKTFSENRTEWNDRNSRLGRASSKLCTYLSMDWGGMCIFVNMQIDLAIRIEYVYLPIYFFVFFSTHASVERNKILLGCIF